MLQNTFADNSLKAEKCAPVNVGASLSGNELLENLAFANRNNKLLAEAVENWAERSSIEYIRESCFNRYSGILQTESCCLNFRVKLAAVSVLQGLKLMRTARLNLW